MEDSGAFVFLMLIFLGLAVVGLVVYVYSGDVVRACEHGRNFAFLMVNCTNAQTYNLASLAALVSGIAAFAAALLKIFFGIRNRVKDTRFEEEIRQKN